MSILHTLIPLVLLATLPAAALAKGVPLKRHSVMADGHPVVVWEKSAPNASEAILLVHGRTWSALPDFDLQVKDEELSLMDGLVAAGYGVFAVDLRGYGETQRDASGWLTPNRAADDVASVVRWIRETGEWQTLPHLFGWSMGSTVSQLMVQRHPEQVASLTLFGYWRDCDEEFEPSDPEAVPLRESNTMENATSDFITPGAISQRAIGAYATAALKADPMRVDVRGHDQYNVLNAGQLRLPVLVIVGEHDPIAPASLQAKLYARIASGHKQYVTVPGGDHAAFLETPRAYFLHALVSFLQGSTLQGTAMKGRPAAGETAGSPEDHSAR